MLRPLLARLLLVAALSLGALGCGYDEASDTGTTIEGDGADGAD